MRDIQHTLIVGITGSGKTHFARRMAARSRRVKIFYDPTMSFLPGGAKDWRDVCARTPAEFSAAVYADGVTNCDIFVDEGDELFSQATPHRWLLQRGRHLGFRVVLISQRPALLDTTCRYQCGRAVVFRCNPTDYKSVLPIYGLGVPPDLDIPMRHYLDLTPGVKELKLCRPI